MEINELLISIGIIGIVAGLVMIVCGCGLNVYYAYVAKNNMMYNERVPVLRHPNLSKNILLDGSHNYFDTNIYNDELQNPIAGR